LASGSNVTLSQQGQTITMAALGPPAPGQRVSQFESQPVEVAVGVETTLLSVTITKSRPESVVLVLATVQLLHVSNPNDRTVEVKLVRDGNPLDAPYEVRIGRANQAVSEIPVSVHTWDPIKEGTYTYSVRAQASARGAEAGVRRLSVIELL
jgi:hypothetical protein